MSLRMGCVARGSQHIAFVGSSYGATSVWYARTLITYIYMYVMSQQVVEPAGSADNEGAKGL